MRVFPTKAFEEYYKSFDYVYEILDTKQWKEEYCHFYDFSDMELDIPIKETKDDQEKFSEEERMEELAKCMESFPYFCHRYVKILNAKFGTIPFLMYRYQHYVIGCFEKERFNILSKFRQGGLTTVAVLYALWQCVTKAGKQILVLSRTDREAVVAGAIVDRALDNMPSWLWDKNNCVITKHEKAFSTDSKICFYTPKAARGRTATMIIIDEAAFIQKMHEEYKGMYPVISTGGHINVISTVNGLGNWYQETYHKALNEKDHPFNVIDIDYWEHPLYANPEWAKTAQTNMGDAMWKQEVLREFLGSGSTYISGEIIQQISTEINNSPPPKQQFSDYVNQKNEKVNIEWGTGALWTWINKPVFGREYIVTVDCGEGLESDNSCIQVIDAISLEQVAEFYSNNIKLHKLTEISYQIGKYYNEAKLVVETTGIGAAVANSLQRQHFYPNLYFEERNIKKDVAGLKVGSANRPLILESFKQRLILGELKIRSSRLINELNTFKVNPRSKRAEADPGKHDDAIMAMAIAVYVREEEVENYNILSENDIRMKMTTLSMKEIQKEINEDSNWSELDMMAKHIDIYEANKQDIKPQRVRKQEELLRQLGY